MRNERHHRTRLRDILPEARYLPADADPTFGAVRTDPHTVEPGDLFVSLDDFDSTDAEIAAGRGAAVIVAERLLPVTEAPIVVVEDCRRATRTLRLAEAAARPSATQRVVVVGSLGSCQAATQLAAAVAARGDRVGLLTEHCDDDGDRCVRSRAGSFDHWLRRCELGRVSVAIAQATADAPITAHPSVVCLTSLRCDGLDARGRRVWDSIAAHRAALAAAAGLQEFSGTLVANADDADAARVAAQHTGRVLSFGESDAADLRVTPLQESPGEQAFLVAHGGDSACVVAPTAGFAARRDAAAAVATAVALGVDLATAASGLAFAPASPARLAPVFAGQGYSVFTDAAIRPLELADALDAAARVPGRVLAVVQLAADLGVGAEQLQVASRLADRVFAVGDPDRGVELPGNVTPVEDRLAAIAVAIGLADEGDAVLLAGAQPDDRSVAAKLIRRRLACEDRRAAA